MDHEKDISASYCLIFEGACLVIIEMYVTGGANAGLFAVRARGRLKFLITLPIDLISTCKIAL